MGVPKLWAFINQRNLGDERLFPQRDVSHGEFHLTHLIFDGPSFAYWLWREASIKQEAYVRYTECIESFVQRLIDNGNFKLTFIFDGGLPKWKQNERAARYKALLHDYTLQSNGQGRLKYLPPPFVVPVCQQTLVRLSRQHDIVVRVVPGEADEFCVHLARDEENSLIVSSDSDFLVHTSETGAFAPLQTFPSQWDDKVILRVYSGLRKKLGLARLNGMIELSALLTEKAQVGIGECIKCVNQNQTLDYLSRETLDEYVKVYTAISSIVTSQAVAEYMESGHLFGRMSELLFSDEVPRFWLPFFPVSNPPRKTPWEISRSIRQEAYRQLVERGLLQGDTVMEMVHRGQRIAEDRVEIKGTQVTWHQKDRREVFMVAIHILLENVSDDELECLPYFAGMFALLQRSSVELSSAIVSPRLQYIAMQYQSIVYSLIILLQSQYPEFDNPEFASLWDLPRFKTAISTPVARGKEIWTHITEQMDPEIQNLWDIYITNNKTQSRRTTRRLRTPTLPKTIEPGNPFALLSTTLA